MAMKVIAVDLGAASGRVMTASFDGQHITLDEVHRFSNGGIFAHDTLYWDVLRLWKNIVTGIEKAGPTTSVGLDTWGVDVALLDNKGQLLSNPVHYRDSRTDGMMEWVFERMPRRDIFERTGIQFMQINGLYQLASLVRAASSQLDAAGTLLTIADLFNYWLSGSKTCEFTIATTTQLYNPHTRTWDTGLIEAVGIPTRILTEIVPPGTRIGAYNAIPVMTTACHDTASAVVGVPTQTPEYAYISSGTWSLLGLELDRPVISDASYAANVTNEGGYGHTYRLLKNIMGMWLIEEARRTWDEWGQSYEYETLAAMALDAPPFRSLFDVDDRRFLPPGDIPERIRAFCHDTAQPPPETAGQVMRAIYESLALKYRLVLDNLIAASGQRVERVHIIGGGSQNALLCQMTADATGRPVVAGPAEATALGNAIVQLIAAGELANLAEAREMLSRSENTITYTPQNSPQWDKQVERFATLLTSA